MLRGVGELFTIGFFIVKVRAGEIPVKRVRKRNSVKPMKADSLVSIFSQF